MSSAVWHALQCCSFLWQYFNSQYWLRFFLCLKPHCGGWPKFFNSKKGSGFPIPHKVSRKRAVMYVVPIESLPSQETCRTKEFTPCSAFCSSETVNAPSPKHRGVWSCSLPRACFTASCLLVMQVHHTGGWRPNAKHVCVCKDYRFRVALARV